MNQREQLEHILNEKVRPALRADGGDVAISGIEDKTLFITYTGACAGCALADTGTRSFIEKAVQEGMPGIERVVIDRPVPEDMMAFARKLLRHEI